MSWGVLLLLLLFEFFPALSCVLHSILDKPQSLNNISQIHSRCATEGQRSTSRQSRHTQSTESTAVLLSPGSNFLVYCSLSHTPIIDVTAGILTITVDENTRCDITDWSQKCSLLSHRDQISGNSFPVWLDVTSGHCSSVNFTSTTFNHTVILLWKPHIWGSPEHFWNNWQHRSHPANHSSVYIRVILPRVERLLPSCLAWSGLLCCCPLTANILKLYSFKGSKSPMSSFASCFETWTSFCSPSVPG